MPRYVAFLRGINVGGHTVKMEDLRRYFEAMGFSNVSTLIASGNVLFESSEADAAALERRIEAALREALGYDAATFLRTGPELAQVAAQDPFPGVELVGREKVYVVFLRAEPDADACQRVLDLATDRDLLLPLGREIYWLPRLSLTDSGIGMDGWSRALGRQLTTTRNMNTVRRLVEKLA
jgi:uncharacterized protein (DUF1697 family)